MQRPAVQSTLREISGGAGDLGTLLPLAFGAALVVGLDAQNMLLGFAVAYIGTGLVYRLPIPVQPMKAVAALAIGGAASAPELAASGVMLGAVLLALGASGLISGLARAVPQSALLGLQLGLGLMLGTAALEMMREAPLLAGALLAVGSLAFLTDRFPAALAVLALAVPLGAWTGAPGLTIAGNGDAALPGLADFLSAAPHVALPQLALTLGNAILLTALVARDCHGERAAHVTPRALCLSSGAINLALTPWGALPMCHGAGGVAAHHRFGARTGAAPVLIGAALAALALWPGAIGVLSLIPQAALGALAIELGLSKRLRSARPRCWPVIGAAALATLAFDPFWGLLAGCAMEWTARRVHHGFET